MKGPRANDALVERLAVATGEAFHAAAGEPTAWARTAEERRATFRLCVRAGLDAARWAKGHGEGVLEATVGRAMSDAFLSRPDCPRWLKVRFDWVTGMQAAEARQFWTEVARALIEAGRTARTARDAAEPQRVTT